MSLVGVAEALAGAERPLRLVVREVLAEVGARSSSATSTRQPSAQQKQLRLQRPPQAARVGLAQQVGAELLATHRHSARTSRPTAEVVASLMVTIHRAAAEPERQQQALIVSPAQAAQAAGRAVQRGMQMPLRSAVLAAAEPGPIRVGARSTAAVVVVRRRTTAPLLVAVPCMAVPVLLLVAAYLLLVPAYLLMAGLVERSTHTQPVVAEQAER